MHPNRLCLSLTLLSMMAVAGCQHAPAQSSDAVTFVVVRHAEKTNDDPRDPSLSPAGQQRAERLAEALRNQPLAAAYATTYRRTQQTAQPAAQLHDLVVSTYDAKQSASDFVTGLRQTHHAGTVLVVGHSNTTPAIAAALCGCTVAPMGEDEFDRRLTISIDASGKASMTEARY